MNKNQFNRIVENILINLFFIIAFVLIGKTSLDLSKVNNFSSVFWLPSGLSIAFIYYRKSYFNLISVILATIILEFITGMPFSVSLIISLANCLEIYLALKLYHKIEHYLHSYIGVQTHSLSIFLTSVFSPIITAIISTYALIFLNNVPSILFFKIAFSWWAGNALGIFLILPFIKLYEWKDLKDPMNLLWISLGALFMGITNFAHSQALFFTVIFIFFIPLFFKRTIGMFLINLTIAAIIFWLNTKHLGPFGFQNYEQSFISSQFAILAIGLIALAVNGFNQSGFIIENKWAIAVIWSIFSLLYFISFNQEQKLDANELNNVSEKFIESLNQKYNIFDNSLRSLSAFVLANKNINQVQLAQFGQTLKLKSIYPEIDSYGVILGKNSSDIIDTLTYPDQAQIYLNTIIHDSNVQNILDRFPIDDVPVLSSRIRLSPTDETVSKSIMLLPIYINQKKVGWTFVVVDFEELFKNVISESRDFQYEIYDQNIIDRKHFVFQNDKNMILNSERTDQFSFANHAFRVIWKKKNNFANLSFSITSLNAFIISIINLLLLSYLYNIKIQRKLALLKNKELESNISSTEARYQSIFNASSDAIVLFNDQEILDFNPMFLIMFEFSEGNIPKNFIELFAIKQNSFVDSNKVIEEQLDKSQSKFEAYCRKQTGLFYAEVSINRFYHNNKQFYIASFADISYRKTIEDNLVAAKESAIEASKSKSRFLSIMSHEIRTPLNGIIGHLQFLLEKEDNQNLNDTQVESLKTIDFSTQHLLHILNEILDYSKIESGKVEFDVRLNNIREFIVNIKKLHIENTKRKNIYFKTDVKSDVPQSLYFDDHRLAQILNNLISNAIKFTKNGGISLEIINEKIENEFAHLKFIISDTGIGIPSAKIDYVFNEFTQASEDHNRNYGGTGLGLPITKKLIELQNGTIEVKSIENLGTQFIFHLKFKFIEKMVEKSDVIGSEITYYFENKKVLLVEDNDVNITVAKRYLLKWGMNVDVAMNGYEAVEKVRLNSYDIILMDFHMPVMDGITATKKIKEFNSSTPIIGLSADIISDDANMMDDFVEKPFKAKILNFTLQKYLKAS